MQPSARVAFYSIFTGKAYIPRRGGVPEDIEDDDQARFSFHNFTEQELDNIINEGGWNVFRSSEVETISRKTTTSDFGMFSRKWTTEISGTENEDLETHYESLEDNAVPGIKLQIESRIEEK